MKTSLLKLSGMFRVSIIILFGIICMTKAYAYNFSAVCETGQTLYYTITDATNHYVSVVYPGNSYSNPWAYYTKPVGIMIIPDKVIYNNIEYQVTNIGAYAFYGCSGLTGLLTIPNSVRNIGAYAFYGCSGLTSLTIGNRVNSIYNYAFYGCSGLTALTIPYSVMSIGEYAFKGCNGLTTVYWEANNVTSYPPNFSNPFSNCPNLSTVTIGYSVETIPANAFYGCSGLTTVHWYAVNVTSYPSLSSSFPFYNCPNLSTVTFGYSVETIPAYAFSGCSGLTSLTIPNSVTSIGGAAFYGCSGLTTVYWNAVNVTSYPSSYSSLPFSNCTNLSTVVFGDSVETIPSYAFRGCSGLTSLTIPNSVTSIGNYAFYGCSGLTTVYWNAVNVTSYPSSYSSLPFSNCTNLSTVVFGGSVETIPAYAFFRCSGLTSLTIPNSVTSIGAESFYGCSGLTSLTLPDSVTSIGGAAFYECSGLTSLTIGNSVMSIGDSAFYGCSGLTGSLTLPDSVTSIGDWAFYGCRGLMSLTIGNSVTNIGCATFSGCSGLTGSLTIPNSVTSIEEKAFRGCSSLTSLTIPNSMTSIGNYAFYGCSGLTSLTIPNSVTSIGAESFYECSGLTSLTIGNSVTSIGNYAFYGCSGLTTIYWNAINVTNNYNSNPNGHPFDNCTSLSTVVFGDSVETIPSYAFRECSSLTSLTIGNSVTSIGNYAFSGCSGLTSLTLPNSVTNIGDHAFSGCSGLTGSLTIPNSVTNIGASAFNGCSSLTSLTIPNSVTSIGNYVFSGCSDLTSLTIPNSVTSIGNYAFSGCSGLTSLTIPNSVTSIGFSAFNGCAILQEVTIGEGVMTIGNYAFGSCPSLTTVYFNATNCTQMYTRAGTGTTSSPYVYSSVFCQSSNNNNSVITTLIIGDNVTRIPNHAFRDCPNLINTTLTIPNSVDYIGSYAFYGYNNLQELTVGEGVTYIGECAFWNCPDLIKVRFNATNCNTMQTLYNNVLYSVFSTNNQGANPNINSLLIGNNVTTIPNCAFKNSQSLQRLIVPASVTTIGDNAFNGCTGLVMLRTQGTGISYIGKGAFCDCSNMVYTMNLPNLNYIGEYAFYNCNSMTGNITIPTSMTSIEPYTFYNCSGLTGSLTIPYGVTSVGDGALYNCSGLNGTLTMPDNITIIGASSFYNCSSLTGNLIIPDNVTTIGASAFYNCSGLTGEIYIPRNTTSIGANTFYNCSSLSGNLLIPKSIETIGEGSFYNCSGLTSIISECINYPTAQDTTFVDMTTTIPIYVPYGQTQNYQAATGWNVFNNYISQFQFEQYDTDEWSDDYNWYTFELPSSNDVVCLNSDCQLNVDASVLYIYIPNPDYTLTIKSGQTLTTQYGIGLDNPSQLIIEEGGHIVYGNGMNYTITADVIAGAGTVTGMGVYAPYSTCTLTAIPDDGYVFGKWTKNGTVVSYNSVISFCVNETECLKASFVRFPLYETFENYTVGNKIADEAINAGNDWWTTWDYNPGGSKDGDIAEMENDKCGHFTYGSDEVLLLGDFTTGVYSLSFDMYIPDGKNAYNNILHIFSGASGSEWSIEAWYKHPSNGSCIKAEGTTSAFECPYDEWFNVRYEIDLDNDVARFYLNDAEERTWQYSLKATGEDGTLQFAGLNFYTPTSTTDFYVDNISFNHPSSTITQSTELTTGWNWWSTYIEQTGSDGLTMLEEGLGEHGEFIQSRTGTMVENFDGYFWWGDLNSVTNEDMYEVKTNAQVNVVITGSIADPASHPITIVPGWNWIGYVSNASNSVDNALSSLTPNADDIIQGRNGFSSYFPGWGWYGDIENMTPGQGYMYKSYGTTSQTLVYPAVTRSTQTVVVDYHYNADYNKYRDLMDVMANVVLNGSMLDSDKYELAAFVDGECRGRAKLQYIEPLDTYLAFLTINGNADEKVTFSLYDENKGVSYNNYDICVVFKSNDVIGKLRSPYTICFNGNEIETSGAFAVYPNPVATGDEITMDFSDDFTEGTLFIENELGLTVDVIKLCGKSEKVRFDLPSGVYVLRVVSDDNIYYKKLIVK